MSTLKTNNYQVGQSGTANQNFTIYQPSTPDGTVRIGVGNAGAVSSDVLAVNNSGNVGIGTSSPSYLLDAQRTAANGTGVLDVLRLRSTADSAGDGPRLLMTCGNSTTGGAGIGAGGVALNSANLLFYAGGNTERARITSDGDLVVGTTTTPGQDITSGTGMYYQEANGFLYVRSNGQVVGAFNRGASDGTILEFKQDQTIEGTISVSGTTVSYNAFAGSHWSQLPDGSKPEILRGTVMESVDELCQWPDEPTSERLCRSKISDTTGSKRVYGVFMDWDNDWTTTNDMMVTSLGAFICRVSADVTVQMGDLLESNGDGTARVQADDVIRSSTIGKVTSTAKTHEYDDGSYCVPTVLYCG
jgi:hypothetical protein